jgi:hypothetical protein
MDKDKLTFGQAWLYSAAAGGFGVLIVLAVPTLLGGFRVWSRFSNFELASLFLVSFLAPFAGTLWWMFLIILQERRR